MEIDLSKLGASQERAKLKQFHSVLNDPNIIPEQSYRRNYMNYPLVCYVNNIIGLVLSKNYEVIPVFINRAIRHMEDRPPSPATDAYYELVLQYLKQVTYVLKNFTALSEESLMSWVPKHVIDAGPQPASNTLLNRNEGTIWIAKFVAVWLA